MEVVLLLKNKLLQIRQRIALEEGVKITGEEMGKILGIGQKMYSRYEIQRSQPSLERAIEFAEALSKYTGRKYTVEDIFYVK